MLLVRNVLEQHYGASVAKATGLRPAVVRKCVVLFKQGA
jgi:hypothetical protein